MIDSTILKDIMWKWACEVGYKINHCSPDVKFVTGNQKTDAQLHSFQIESGTEITLTKDFKDVEKYSIIDERKFMWFVLRWS